MSIPLAAVAFVSLGWASPSAATPLDGLIGFVDPYWCETSENYHVLKKSLLRWEEAGQSYLPILETPKVPAAFQTQVGEPRLTITGREYRATLPLSGTWRGLPLRALVIVGWIESEEGFDLVFDATPAQVLEAATQAGFNIPATGSEYRDDVNLALGMYVAVTAVENGRGALSCFPG